MGSADVESGTRSRTRRAILGAAAEVLAHDRAATLAEIAKAAQVGRSTLHRYFPDRDVLVQAAIADAYLVIQQSIQDAAVGDGPPLEGLRRLVAALVGTGSGCCSSTATPASSTASTRATNRTPWHRW